MTRSVFRLVEALVVGVLSGITMLVAQARAAVGARAPTRGPGWGLGMGRTLGPKHAGAALLTGLAGVGIIHFWGGANILSGRLSPEAAARAALGEARAERERENDAMVHALIARQQQTLEVARGESLALVLARADIAWSDINAAVEAVSAVYDPRHMREGQQVEVFYDGTSPAPHLTGLAFRADPGASVSVNRSVDGNFHARAIQTPWRLETAHVVAKISGSLYQSAIDAGATEREVAAISNVFSYDIDFQRDVFPGDTFEMLFERYTDEEGRTIKTGDLNFVELNTRRGPRAYYFFRAPGESEGAWYDAAGHSAKKFLMKTPIDGARLTSTFGMRLHPILGYSRMHKGVDFAAHPGTPVRAAGDGIVEKANWFGGYGNYVRIRHGDNYDTAYAHLSGYAVRAGQHVAQGEVIGYVGATGEATGPHLHYEVLRYNEQINPMKVSFATGRNLDGQTLAAFQAVRAHIEAQRAGGAALLASAVGGAGLRGGLE